MNLPTDISTPATIESNGSQKPGIAPVLNYLIRISRDCMTAYQLAAISTQSAALRIFFARLADQRAVFVSTLEDELAAISAAGAEGSDPGASTASPRDGETSAWQVVASAVRISNDNRHLLEAVSRAESQVLQDYLRLLAGARQLTFIQRSFINYQRTCVSRARDLIRTYLIQNPGSRARVA